jgi:hypothetical protein
MSMVSPFKLFDDDRNYFSLGFDKKLAEALQVFFSDTENDHLWAINTHRQKTTYALRNTESIMLRKLELKQKLGSTIEYNQVMDVGDSDLYKLYPIFKIMVEKLNSMFIANGATTVEYGRIFFSKFLAHSSIDEHTDEGKYFSYYDRFHFVIDSPEDCVFQIREDPIYLKTAEFAWVNNHVPHWLENRGASNRINLILDARLL